MHWLMDYCGGFRLGFLQIRVSWRIWLLCDTSQDYSISPLLSLLDLFYLGLFKGGCWGVSVVVLERSFENLCCFMREYDCFINQRQCPLCDLNG